MLLSHNEILLLRKAHFRNCAVGVTIKGELYSTARSHTLPLPQAENLAQHMPPNRSFINNASQA